MGYFLIYKTAHGSLHGAMAKPFKSVCNRNPSYFQFVKIMQLEGLNLLFSFFFRVFAIIGQKRQKLGHRSFYQVLLAVILFLM